MVKKLNKMYRNKKTLAGIKNSFIFALRFGESDNKKELKRIGKTEETRS